MDMLSGQISTNIPLFFLASNYTQNRARNFTYITKRGLKITKPSWGIWIAKGEAPLPGSWDSVPRHPQDAAKIFQKRRGKFLTPSHIISYHS